MDRVATTVICVLKPIPAKPALAPEGIPSLVQPSINVTMLGLATLVQGRVQTRIKPTVHRVTMGICVHKLTPVRLALAQGGTRSPVVHWTNATAQARVMLQRVHARTRTSPQVHRVTSAAARFVTVQARVFSVLHQPIAAPIRHVNRTPVTPVFAAKTMWPMAPSFQTQSRVIARATNATEAVTLSPTQTTMPTSPATTGTNAQAKAARLVTPFIPQSLRGGHVTKMAARSAMALVHVFNVLRQPIAEPIPRVNRLRAPLVFAAKTTRPMAL